MYKYQNFYIAVYRNVGKVYIKAKCKGQWRKTVIDLEQWERIKDIPGVALNAFYNHKEDQSGVRFKIYINGQVRELSRFLNDTPEGLVCDHINFRTWDNTRDNLRNITVLQNLKHRKKTVERRKKLKNDFLPVLFEIDKLMNGKKTKNTKFKRAYIALKKAVNDL